MEGENEMCVSPLVQLPAFREGDLVHVFEGTGVGKVGNRSVGWFGRVVGSDGSKYLVRNRLLSARGSPNLVDGQFLKLQTDYSLSNGISEERVHYRTLSKRTRERVLASADEQNNNRREQAEKELVRVKKIRTQEKQSYLSRREQIEQQGMAVMKESKSVFDEQVHYWQAKCESLEQQKKSLNDHNRTASKRKEVLNCLVLSFRVFSCHVYCLVSFGLLLSYFVMFFLVEPKGTDALRS
jgi:hypothetical protein